MSGNFLPMQLVYQGKTPKCHPAYNFPTDWHITHSPNHWSNKHTMKDYLVKVLVPLCAFNSIARAHTLMGVVSSNGNHENINHEMFNISEPQMFCPPKITRYTVDSTSIIINL